ncbi:MAG: putative Rossmann fold flavoprotein [Planctomycetota bacterium]|jgi:predicted Rossmann fold flavoprotein
MTTSSNDVHGIVVVGAGAAGLWAAQSAAKLLRASSRDVDVLLLEKTPRSGTKVLASGGTRCNLTTTLDPQRAAQLFGKAGSRFLRTAFRTLTPTDVRTQFDEWGVPSVEAPLDKVFPESGNARHVRDALQKACTDSGVVTRHDVSVRGVHREKDHWRVVLEDGETIGAKRLLLCPGGKSYPLTGTTGDGYEWLRELELELVAGVPALVPLLSPASWVHALTGLSAQNATVRLRNEDGKALMDRTRPVLFTHRGLSGPGPMDVSRFVAQAVTKASQGAWPTPVKFVVEIDLMPQCTHEDLTEQLRFAATRTGSPLISKLFSDDLPRRLVEAACVSVDLPADIRTNVLPKAGRHKLVTALKGLSVPISGTASFDEAEVTAGGLALSELDPGSMRVRKYEDLFVFGEVIDLDGPIGGLNFQSAFATAELAARAAVKP